MNWGVLLVNFDPVVFDTAYVIAWPHLSHATIWESRADNSRKVACLSAGSLAISKLFLQRSF